MCPGESRTRRHVARGRLRSNHNISAGEETVSLRTTDWRAPHVRRRLLQGQSPNRGARRRLCPKEQPCTHTTRIVPETVTPPSALATDSAPFADEGPSAPVDSRAPGWKTQREAALRAVVARLLEGAPEHHAAIPRVAREVRRRIDGLPEHKRRDLWLALDLLRSRLVGLVTLGRPVGFAQASSAQQDRWLTSWSRSPVAPLRTAFQAFRRLTLGAHYGAPSVAAAIGHLGPLHLREPSTAWEGPLPNEASISGTLETRADGAVARGNVSLRRTLTPTVAPAGVVVGSSITADRHRTADVVVIGSGAGGAVAAARLAEAGLEVVVLEEGGYYTAADFTETEVPLAEQLYADGALRATDDLAVQMLQGRSVGGSTTINWMIMLRTPDFVFDEWQRLFGLTDYSAAAMASVFARVEEEVHAKPVPDDAHSPNNRIILDGARALGWHASSAIINAKGCVRSGFCGIGCRYDAKQGALLTYIPRALAHGATLYADVRAHRIEVRERDRGTGAAPLKRVHAVVIDRRSGVARHALTIDAPLVVMAGGAVGTPVLLQRSGLGGGGVGRFLRVHPVSATVADFDHEILGSTGIPLSTMCDEHLRWQGSDYGFWLECPPFLPALGAVAAPGFGAAHAALMQRFRHLSSVIALTRDGADTRTSSGNVSLRRDGAVSIRYALTAADAQRVQASIEAAARLQLAAGAREVRSLHTQPLVARREADLKAFSRASVRANDVGLFTAHVNGTCRMGTDARIAGANPDGERFGARGVFVCDGSLLPTALGVNPQSTIMALATVVSERLAARYGPASTTHGDRV